MHAETRDFNHQLGNMPFVLSLLLGGMLVPLQADDTAISKPQMGDYFSQMESPFKGLSGFSLHGTQVTQLNPKLFSADKLKAPNTGSVSIVFSDNKFYIQDDTATGSEGYKIHQIETYDGKVYQAYNESEQRLFVETTNDPHINPLRRWSNPFLQPWEFFSPGRIASDYDLPSLKELKNEDYWKTFPTRIKNITDGSYGNKDCLILEIPSGKEVRTQADSYYRVYLSKQDGYFPIAWERNEVATSHPIYIYHVDELAAVSINRNLSIYYPKKSTLQYFGASTLKNYTGTEIAQVRTVIDSFQINPQSSPDAFTIDPSRASTIWDQDHNILINVPH
jgi:hypothetical protein